MLVALPDPFGRLVGKRFRADVFLESVAKQGTHGCNYLLTVNMEMDPLDGFQSGQLGKGFWRFHVAARPRRRCACFRGKRRRRWCICDHVKHDGSLVAEAPRSVLRGQLERLARKGFDCFCASELEFYLFNQTYHSAFTSGYRELQPSSDYRIDYHLMQPTRDEALMRAIRNGMTGAGIPIESSKGEWSRGQHEINFIYTEPLPMADLHVLFKQGIKEIAEQHGKAVSFMAKYAPTRSGQLVPYPHELVERGPERVPGTGRYRGPGAQKIASRRTKRLQTLSPIPWRVAEVFTGVVPVFCTDDQ